MKQIKYQRVHLLDSIEEKHAGASSLGIIMAQQATLSEIGPKQYPDRSLLLVFAHVEPDQLVIASE
jgi:hypothetical protein